MIWRVNVSTNVIKTYQSYFLIVYFSIIIFDNPEQGNIDKRKLIKARAQSVIGLLFRNIVGSRKILLPTKTANVEKPQFF